MAREKRGKSGKRKPRRGNRAARPRSTKKPGRSHQATRKPKPAPKPAVVRKRPAAPKKRKQATTIRRPALWELTLEDKVVYRDALGNVVPKGTRGARKSVYTWGKDEVTGRKRLVAKVEPTLTQKMGSVDSEGPDMGRIDMALVNSSATQAIGVGTGAERLEFTIKSKDHRGKNHRFKISFDLGEVTRKRKLYRAVVGRILQELRRRGYRTNYTLELFKQARLKGLKYPVKWNKWRKLDVLHDMEITVTIFK